MSDPLALLYQEEVYAIPPKVTVVLARPWDQYNDADQMLLNKILGSVKLSLAAVRIVIAASVTPEVLSSLGVSSILIFGSKADDIPLYHVSQAQGFSVVRADDLSELNDTTKKSLWLALKAMFAI